MVDVRFLLMVHGKLCFFFLLQFCIATSWSLFLSCCQTEVGVL